MELRNVSKTSSEVKKFSWTDEQEKAITERGNILVSAAAGSGKTAVLVERVIRRIMEEEIDVDKILAITFTNAAAKEMKKRVSDKIKSKLSLGDSAGINVKFLKRQLSLLSRSNISTLHAFCFKLIKENFLKLGIKPTVKVATQEEIKILKSEVLDKITEKLYDSSDSGFGILVDKYASYKDDNKLREIIFNLMDFLDGLPFRKAWQNDILNELKSVSSSSKTFEETEIGKRVIFSIDESMEYYLKMYNSVLPYLSDSGAEFQPKVDILSNELRVMSLILSTDSLEEKLKYINSLEFDRWPSKGKSDSSDEAKDFRTDFKNTINSMKEKYIAITSEERALEASESYLVICELFKVVGAFYDEYKKVKLEKNILDFSDLEHLALEVLYDSEIIETDKKIEYKYYPSEISKELKKYFKEVQVDEYQDINSVQEKIIAGVSNDNLFQVGDVKQSIYGFRKARPKLFMSKHDSYSDIYDLEKNISESESMKEYMEENNIPGKLIRLHTNFRSKNNIIDFCNGIFKTIMTKDTGMINYTKEEYLHPGPNANISDDNIPEIEFVISDEESKHEILNSLDSSFRDNVESMLYEYDKTDKEAIAIAKKILEMKTEAESKGEEFKFGDIAILLRSTKKKSEIYQRRLEEAGIKTHSEAREGLLGSLDIELIFSFLKVISNPTLDIDLLGVMRSYFGYFEIDDLTRIRLNNIRESFYESCLAYLEYDDIIEPSGEGISDFETANLKNRLKKFLSKLEYFREKAESSSLYDVVSEIVYDSGYYEYLMLKESDNTYISGSQKNIEELMKKISEFQEYGINDIHKFIRYVEDLKEKEAVIEISSEALEDDSRVKIMSIHRSKGLEFKTIILGDSNKLKNNMSLRSPIVYDEDLGIGIDIIDEKFGVKSQSIYKSAIIDKIAQEEFEEEMRVLYVALTRAEEKIIIGAHLDSQEKLNKKIDEIKEGIKVNSYIPEEKSYDSKKIYGRYIKKLRSYLDYILLSIHLHNMEFKEDLVISDKIIISNIQNEINQIGDFKNSSYKYIEDSSSAYASELIHKKLEAINTNNKKRKNSIPRKLSVSNITSRIKKSS